MEASQAQAAGQGGDGAAEGQQAEATSTEGMTPDQIAEMFGELRGGQDELRQLLQSQAQPAAPQEPVAAEPQQPDMDLTFMDPSDPYFNPEQAAERLAGLVEQAASSRAEALIREQVAPISEQMADMRRNQEASALVAEFPELGEEGVADEVVAVARQIAESPQVNNPALADEPWFWRLTYMAAKAAETAQGETGEQPGTANLEGGGGAIPAGGSGKDLGDEIVGSARGGASVLPFS